MSTERGSYTRRLFSDLRAPFLRLVLMTAPIAEAVPTKKKPTIAEPGRVERQALEERRAR
jgi:hypothetical protein